MTPGDFLTEIVLNRYSRREVIKRGMALGFSAPVITMLLAACGGDDDDDDDDGGDTADPTATTESTDEAEPTEPESDDGEATEEDAGEATEADSGDEEPTEADGGEDEEPTTEDSGSSGGGEMNASGSIVLTLANEPLSLESDEATSAAGYPVIRNINEALVNRDPATNEIVGELAESWEQVDDLTWHFKLREGVTFHDGEPFTAEVAAYGLNYSFDPDSGFSVLVYMGPQISASAVDEYTLEVTTAEPDPILPTRLYFCAIPSMKQLEEDPESALEAPIGTGPYSFVEWARGQYIRITANPDWWGHGGVDPYGTVTIQDAEFVFRPESAVRAGQIQAGEAQFANLLTPEDVETLPNGKTSPSTESLFLRPDIMYPVMADVRIRQAISYAIDLESVAEFIYPGAVPASQIYGPATFGYNEAMEPHPYDMEQAAALVEEAAADGVPIDMPIIVATRASVAGDSEFVQYVQEQLNQIGLTAQSEIIEDALFTAEVWNTGRTDVAADRGWLALIPHGNELMDASASFGRYYSCDTVVSDGTYCNEELEPRIQEALGLAGDERQQAYEELSEAYAADYPTIPVVHLAVNYGLAENLVWEPRLDMFSLLKEMSFS